MITVQEALASMVSNLAHAVADRCEDVLPAMELREAFPYFLALWQHGAQGTESTFAELLALQLKVERLSATDVATSELLVQAAAYGYLASDTSTTSYGAEPNVNPHVKPRVDGTVHGARRAVVVGDDEHDPVPMEGAPKSNYRAADGADLIRRADMWLHAGEGPGKRSPIPLLGNEVTSWEQFVPWSPEELDLTEHVTVNGAPMGKVVFAPEGAGDSIVWQSEANRKRKAWHMRRATYAPASRPDEIVHLPQWGADGSTLRILKRYRTSLRFGPTTYAWQENEEGTPTLVRTLCPVSRIIGGKRGWVTGTVRTVKVPRGPKSKVREMSKSEALETLKVELESAYERNREYRSSMKVGDHRVTVRLVPTERRYRCSVTSKEHGSKQSAPRTLSAALAFIARHTVS